MSRTGKTPVYNHVWYQQNQAKIYPWSGESWKVFAVSDVMNIFQARDILIQSEGLHKVAQQSHSNPGNHSVGKPNDWVNTVRPRQNGRHFADDTFKHIFLNENVCSSIEISLKFVPKGPKNNMPSLVQRMAWRRPGDKPLSEPMMVNLPTHLCATRPQWVKINGLMQERCNSSVLAMELRFSCTKPSTNHWWCCVPLTPQWEYTLMLS